MSTRGFLGFVIDGQEKIAYNHSDSYPEHLGVNVLGWARFAATNLDKVRELAVALRVVSDNDQPTDKDIERLAQFHNPGVGDRTDRPTWYQLLRETQGSPAAVLQAGALEDASGFPADSLFAEWGYIVDLDAQTFEVYQGFQKERHDKGRFASRPFDDKPSASGDTYYPVALTASWPLKDLPSGEDFVGAFYSAEDDDE
jgi:hypothetical protein